MTCGALAKEFDPIGSIEQRQAGWDWDSCGRNSTSSAIWIPGFWKEKKDG